MASRWLYGLTSIYSSLAMWQRFQLYGINKTAVDLLKIRFCWDQIRIFPREMDWILVSKLKKHFFFFATDCGAKSIDLKWITRCNLDFINQHLGDLHKFFHRIQTGSIKNSIDKKFSCWQKCTVTQNEIEMKKSICDWRNLP